MAKKTVRRNSPHPPAETSLPRTLHVLSDATGNLAQHMLAALLTQFPPGVLDLRLWTFQKTKQQIEATLKNLDRTNAAVLHALVSPESKKLVNTFCAKHNMPCHDLTVDLSRFIERITGHRAVADASRLHAVDRAYHRRIESMEFTLDHDDGTGLETLHEADIVLTGVSRTSKTPTSVLLAQYGYKVANVSLAIEVDPPAELLAMPPAKVVALTIAPDVLTAIRARRNAEWRMGETTYCDFDHVQQELRWCKRLFARQGWHVLDVTNHAVEETAARVLDLLGLPRIGVAR